MKIGFDNAKYITLQAEHIKERIGQFGGNLSTSGSGLTSSAISCIWNLAESCLMTITPHAYCLVLSPIARFVCSKACLKMLR